MTFLNPKYQCYSKTTITIFHVSYLCRYTHTMFLGWWWMHFHGNDGTLIPALCYCLCF